MLEGHTACDRNSRTIYHLAASTHVRSCKTRITSRKWVTCSKTSDLENLTSMWVKHFLKHSTALESRLKFSFSEIFITGPEKQVRTIENPDNRGLDNRCLTVLWLHIYSRQKWCYIEFVSTILSPINAKWFILTLPLRRTNQRRKHGLLRLKDTTVCSP